jgi:hypothetical protein
MFFNTLHTSAFAPMMTIKRNKNLHYCSKLLKSNQHNLLLFRQSKSIIFSQLSKNLDYFPKLREFLLTCLVRKAFDRSVELRFLLRFLPINIFFTISSTFYCSSQNPVIVKSFTYYLL